MTSAQAKELMERAKRAGVVAAVTFNYRGNPLVQHARAAIARGDVGTPYFIHGHYLQDYLIKRHGLFVAARPVSERSLVGGGRHWFSLV